MTDDWVAREISKQLRALPSQPRHTKVRVFLLPNQMHLAGQFAKDIEVVEIKLKEEKN